MSAMPDVPNHMTEAEYLEFERQSEEKHEFINREVLAMTGASQNHNLITGSMYVALYTALRGRGCQFYPSDMKVNIPATGSYAYPDITVVCGESAFLSDKKDVLLNPVVIVEVLSPSTEAYDRGLKFQHYREIDTLKTYLIVSQDKPLIEKFERHGDGFWQFSEAYGLDAELTLPELDIALPLAQVYEQVTFQSDDDSTSGEETDS